MDPEIIAQLEEQLRELTDTISRQTSMMGEQMAAMNKMAGSASSNAKATDGATQATTKYQEAQQKAYNEQEKTIQTLKKFDAALGVLSASVGAAAGVLGSVANSLLSSQKGLAKYGEVANQAAAGAEKMASSIPIVGDALGALVGTIGKIGAKLVSDGLAMVDSLTTLRDGLVKTGGSLPVTAGQLADLARDARYSGENMKVLGKITESLGTGLRSLDATAGRGATKFMEMANVTDETRRQFGRMGVDQERLTELQALYVKQQQASGNSYDLQTKTAAQLRRESLAYAENMQKLSALTGKQAEQLQAEQEAVAAVVQERMATLKEMSDEKRLRDAGRGEEADAIRDERLKRQKFAQELQKMGLTQDEQMKAMQMYRLGAYTDYTKSMAQLNPGLMSLAQGVKNGSVGIEQGAKEFGEGLTEGKIRMSTNLNGIADAIDPQTLGDTFGLTSDSLKGPLDQLGASLGESKKAADADTEAAKTRSDATADAVENIRSAEREMQAKYQDYLMTQIESISKLINQVDIFTEVQEHAATVAKVMAAGMAAVTAGNVALAAAAWKAAGNLEKIAMGMGGGGGGGPLGEAEGAAKGKGGFLKRFGGRLLGGVGGLLGGLALDYGAEKAEEAGYKKTSGALGVGSAALTGAGFGAMFGPMGALIGGAAGGLYGLYSNRDKLFGGAAGGLTAEQQAKIANEKIIEDQMAQNRKLFQEPLQQTEEERKKQAQSFTDLSNSMGLFKKNIDNTNKAFIDLLDASDELYKALTGRDRPGSEKNKSSPTGSPGAGMTFGGDTDKVLATIRQKESTNNYTAKNPSSSASGAYQFTDGTWQDLTKKLGIGTEYKRAMDAPAAVQDQVAKFHLENILKKSGGDLSKVPIAWFTGNVAGKSNVVSQDQIASYSKDWFNIYNQMSGSGPGMPGNMGGTIGLFQMMNQSGYGMMGGGIPPAMMAGSIIPLGMALQGMGLRISEHPSFGGVLGQHSQAGGHYDGTAIDVNVGVGNKEADDPVMGAKFDSLAQMAKQAGYHVVWRAPGHYDHMHIQYSQSMGANSKIGAARGGIFRGPKDGYPMELHGTEMILPLDTPSMQGNKIFDLMSSLTKTGVKEGGIGKINRIQDAITQVVNSETTKAIKAVNEANGPMQNISTEISNSMRQVMEAHNKTMNELTYKLSDMIDALHTSNDVTKKILKKASA